MRSGAYCRVLLLLKLLSTLLDGFDEFFIGFPVENQEACIHVSPRSVRGGISARIACSWTHFAQAFRPNVQRGSPFSTTPVASRHDLSGVVSAIPESLWEVRGFEHYAS